MNETVIGPVALCAAVVQAAAMGFIGYPIARIRPGGMEKFHRSGFHWWIITLAAISLAGALCWPESLALTFPSQHGASLLRILGGAAVAFAVCLAIELGNERLDLGPGDTRARTATKADEALPRWAQQGAGGLALMALVSVLEEFVFRSLALGSLWHVWDLPKVVCAGLVAAVFGLSHWYYGLRQVVVKSLDGTALVWAALTGGWVAAALAHVALNVTTTLITARRPRRSEWQSR